MSKSKLKGKDLLAIGYQQGRVVGIAINIMAKYYHKDSQEHKIGILKEILASPESYLEHEIFGLIAKELLPPIEAQNQPIALREKALPYETFGLGHIEIEAIAQMDTAMQLPVTVAGALMPDAHSGYGLPIGGVLAVENAVIPYGVGMDIGCRMCLTLYDIPVSYLEGHKQLLVKYLNENTRFGMLGEFEQPIDHEVLESPLFKEIPFIQNLKSKAWRQIGSSGGGNHFVEFGIVDMSDPNNEFGLPIGKYMGILSHSGSRGLGATIANHYTELAIMQCKLPKHAKHLAWLSLNSETGQEYWAAMNLAGQYASACHHQIHERLGKALGEKPLAMVENHHNFAWKETAPNGTEVIVHRKGATPATKGVLGIIPGSMTAAGYIVRGKGNPLSINSASHGAGRAMSRRKALQSITESTLKKHLKEHGVTLIGGGLDEAPMAYKNINQVMRYQQDLIEILGTFMPKIVRMADD